MFYLEGPFYPILGSPAQGLSPSLAQNVDHLDRERCKRGVAGVHGRLGWTLLGFYRGSGHIGEFGAVIACLVANGNIRPLPFPTDVEGHCSR